MHFQFPFFDCLYRVLSRWFSDRPAWCPLECARRFGSDESGATAIEYGLIVALVSVGLIAVLAEVGTRLQETFTRISEGLAPP